MKYLSYLFCFFIISIFTACSENNDVSDTRNTSIINSPEENSEAIKTEPPEVISQDSEPSDKKPVNVNYNQLRKLITFGKATIFEVKQALTEQDVVGLSNTLHALYSMRWHRGVYHLYYDLWHLKKDKYSDFAWESLEKVPARIALASTINRAQIYDTDEFKSYIRSHMHDEHEFHRAQVVVALGLNGDPDDVDYIKSMAAGDNHYVTQSAISSLAMVGHVQAQDAMIELYNQYKGTPRGKLLLELLKKSYKWSPTPNIN
jgi:hypothetical protein